MPNINDYLPNNYQKPTKVASKVADSSFFKNQKVETPKVTAPTAPTKIIAPIKKKKKRPILTAILLILLLAGSVSAYFLMQEQQDNRQQASGNCVGEVENCYSPTCADEKNLVKSCIEKSSGRRCWVNVNTCSYKCRNAQCDSKPVAAPTDACATITDSCTQGSPNSCQAKDTDNTSNGNTGYMCKCEPAGGGTDCYVWKCNDYQPENCPVASGNEDLEVDSACGSSGWTKLGNGCLKNDSDESLAVNQYTCPDMTWAEAGGGCPSGSGDTNYNLKTINVSSGQSVCLGSDYCGVRQIDAFGGGSSCFVSGERECDPTSPPTQPPTQEPEPIICGESGCQTDGDCATGLICVQPQMPPCEGEGLDCAQVMPDKVCSKNEYQTACIEDPKLETCCQAPVLMCRNIEILDSLNQTLTADDDQNFVVGETTIKFKCFASDSERVDHFEFGIIEPDNSITYLAENSNTPAISEEYLIAQSGDFAAECRVCETATSCQAWTSSTLLTIE